MPRKPKEKESLNEFKNEKKDEFQTEKIKKSVSTNKNSKQEKLQNQKKATKTTSNNKPKKTSKKLEEIQKQEIDIKNESESKLKIGSKTKANTSSEESSKSKKVSSSKKSKSEKKSTTTNTEKTNLSKSTSNKKTKTTSKRASTTKKSTSKSKSSTPKRKVEVLEYYDLPYRYNQTIVKVLSQTPTTLFVYWDISDLDKQNLINEYGEKFFEETKPFLIIHNETYNYSFEVEINDFANSWYLHIPDSKCIYNIELCRKLIKNNESINQTFENYIYITSSNKMEAPNDHILFDSLGDTVYFRNVKTNIIEGKKIASLSFIQNIEKIYNIYDIYQKIYPEENIKYFNLNNPSSGNPSSSFR